MVDKTIKFSVRALSPDNDLVINQLIELFNSCYGDQHPNRNVYSTQYWRSHIVTRFISLAMICDGRIVAHLAILPDSNDPSVVQLIFPAIDPQYKHFESEMNPLLKEAILAQAKRKKWRSVFYYDYVGAPTSGTFTLPILGEIDTALAPGYFPRLDPSQSKSESNVNVRSEALERRFAIQVRQAILNGTLSEQHTLYVPARHQEIIKYLYEPFSLNRQFVTESSAESYSPEAIPADSPAYFDEVYPPIEVRHIFIQPSLITDVHRMSLFTPDADIKASFVFVNLRDSKAPAFCNELAQAGFKFCGIMPYFFGRENVTYFRSEYSGLDLELISGERARTLAQYMERDSDATAIAIESEVRKVGETSQKITT